MKTAQTIEEQTERKKTDKSYRPHADNGVPVSVEARAEARRRQLAAIRPFQFKPGISGNSGGRPARDLAGEIAQALFEQDGPAIFAAFQRVLRKDSHYRFAVLADRAFGRLKETHMIERSPYKDVSNEEIEKHIEELQGKLIAHLVEQGYTITKPPQFLPAADEDSKVQ